MSQEGDTVRASHILVYDKEYGSSILVGTLRAGPDFKLLTWNRQGEGTFAATIEASQTEPNQVYLNWQDGRGNPRTEKFRRSEGELQHGMISVSGGMPVTKWRRVTFGAPVIIALFALAGSTQSQA